MRGLRGRNYQRWDSVFYSRKSLITISVFGVIWKLWICSFKWGMITYSAPRNDWVPSKNVEVTRLRLLGLPLNVECLVVLSMRTSSILSMYALKTYMPFPGALYPNFSEVHNLCHCEVHWEFNSKCLLCCPLPGIFGTSRPTRGSPDSTATRNRTSTWSGTWLSRRRSATLMTTLRVTTGDRFTLRKINVLLRRWNVA